MRKTPAGAPGKGRWVAVDLGISAVRVVEVEWSSVTDLGGPRILRRGMASLPPRTWADLSSHRDAVATAIRDAMKSSGIIARTAVACLPRRLVTIRNVKLPHTDPEQLRSMIAFEAQQYIPFPMEDVILDYFVAPENFAGGLTGAGEDLDAVLLVAARRSLIADIISIFAGAGLQVSRLSTSALAVAEHMREASEPTAVVDIEPGEVDIAVVANGRLLFTRAVAFEASGLAPGAAEAKLADDVARSLRAYQNEFRLLPIVEVRLTGPGQTIGDAGGRDLSALLELPVLRLEGSLFPAGDPDAGSYAAATGMALQAAGPGMTLIDLMPHERQQKRSDDLRRTWKLVGGGIALAVLIGAGLIASSWLTARDKLQQLTFRENLDLQDAKAREADVTKTYNRANALNDALSNALDRNHPVVDVLAAVNRALPASPPVWLTQLSFDRAGLLTLRGQTHFASAATDLVLGLQRTGAFTEVKLGYLGDAQDTSALSGSGAANGPRPTPGTIPTLPGMPASTAQPPTPPAPGGPPPPGRTGAGAPSSAMPATPTGPPGTGPGGSLRPNVTNGAAAASNTAAPQPGGRAVRRPKVVVTHADSSSVATLTGFVITCKINRKRADLLPAQAEVALPKKSGIVRQTVAAPVHSAGVGATDVAPEPGDDNADSQ